ncbi:hypothetical protein N656DRAFT_799374 [Canariomyces notabilis]|uniref:Uncharacterized protein n=1 Tax=Canariomyces notabilis TaxID=2074819 RepID=A0AAN6TB26_9PEZI|nr:hypothetical protein N656DRAFT_799374 [Canariomyces arenarius]
MADLPVPRNPSWPTDQADPASCSAAGEFFAMWLTTPEQIKARTYRGPGIDVTARYLRVLFGASTENWSDGQLVHWFQDTQAEAERRYSTQPGSPDLGIFFNEYIKPAVDGCSASVCRSLGWQGNTDLAGIGVFSSYCIEAALATIYLVVLLANRFKIWKKGRVLDSFLGTVSDLVQGVFVFSVAIMIASLHSIVKVLDQSDYSVTTYEIVTAMLVTIFSVCPATLLYAIGGNSKGPKPILRPILLVIWILMLAVVNLGRTTDPSRQALAANTIGHPFEVYCQVIGSAPLEAARIFAVAAAEGGKEEDGRAWRVIVSVLACLVMWFFLGLFAAMRATIIDVAGDSDKSNEWSFGQIVALASWAPVVLNFFYLLFLGVEKGQGSKLPHGYTITSSDTGNGGAEGGGGQGGE